MVMLVLALMKRKGVVRKPRAADFLHYHHY